MRLNKLMIVPAFAAALALGACAEEEPYTEPALEEPVVTEPVMTEPVMTEPMTTDTAVIAPPAAPLEQELEEAGQELEATGQTIEEEVEEETAGIRY